MWVYIVHGMLFLWSNSFRFIFVFIFPNFFIFFLFFAVNIKLAQNCEAKCVENAKQIFAKIWQWHCLWGKKYVNMSFIDTNTVEIFLHLQNLYIAPELF